MQCLVSFPLFDALVILRRSTPLHGKLAALNRTVTKIQIDQRLVGDSGAHRKRAKVLDGGLVDPQRDLLLKPPSVGVLARFGEIVLFSHFVNLSQYCFCSALVARRALISRMREPLSRTQWQTDRTRSAAVMPRRMKRASVSEWSGSSSRRACSSRKAVSASSNETLCLRRFR